MQGLNSIRVLTNQEQDCKTGNEFVRLLYKEGVVSV